MDILKNIINSNLKELLFIQEHLMLVITTLSSKKTTTGSSLMTLGSLLSELICLKIRAMEATGSLMNGEDLVQAKMLMF